MITIGRSKSHDINIDLDRLIETRMLIQAMSGAGKSWLLRRLLELSHGKVQQIVIDLEGEFVTLREKYDYVVAGRGGDIPADIKSAKLLAQRLQELRASAILDVSDLKKHDRIKYVRIFLEALIAAPKHLRHPIMVVVDEAHHFCMDAKTEILTKDGWRKHDEVHRGDIAIAFSPESGSYNYEPIKRVIIKEHDGEMVAFKSQNIDCLVTPDHRVVLARTKRARGKRGLFPWTFCRAVDVPTQFCIPVGCGPDLKGIPELDETTLRILGWVITDGHLVGTRKGSSNRYLGITQSPNTIKHGTNITEQMDKILLPLGAKKTTRIRQAKTMPNGNRMVERECCEYYLGKKLNNLLLGWLRNDIHRVPREILDNASKDQLRALYLGLLEGNGTAQGDKWVAFYPGQNEGQADDFQEVAIRLGVSVTKTWVPSIGQWHCRIATRKHHYVRRPQTATYKGLVWDITIPSGAFIARRNGKVFVTGNCPEKGQAESAPAVIDLATRGRKRGLCAVLATQRLSKLHKDAAAECGNKMIGRTVQDIDRKRASEELGFTKRDEMLSLRGLPDGGFHVYGPAFYGGKTRLSDIELVQVGGVVTKHPKIGSRNTMTAPVAATAKLKSIIASLADLPEQAATAAKELEDYKRECATLRRENTLLEKQAPVTDCGHGPELTALRGQVGHLMKAIDDQAGNLKRTIDTFFLRTKKGVLRVKGERVKIFDYVETFVCWIISTWDDKGDHDLFWFVAEETTGLTLGMGDTRGEAINRAKLQMMKHGEWAITECIENNPKISGGSQG